MRSLFFLLSLFAAWLRVEVECERDELDLTIIVKGNVVLDFAHVARLVLSYSLLWHVLHAYLRHCWRLRWTHVNWSLSHSQKNVARDTLEQLAKLQRVSPRTDCFFCEFLSSCFTTKADSNVCTKIIKVEQAAIHQRNPKRDIEIIVLKIHNRVKKALEREREWREESENRKY